MRFAFVIEPLLIFIKLILCIVVTGSGMCFKSLAYAEPQIQSVSGTPTMHRSQLRIRGTGFGEKKPAKPLIWDDAEGKTVGDLEAIISEGGWTEGLPKAATVKSWWRMQYRKSGWMAMPTYGRGNQYLVGGHWNNYTEQAENVGLTKSNGRPSYQWYATWYVRLNFPPIDRCFIGNGNYKEYVFNSGKHGFMYDAPFCYSATAAEYADLVNGGKVGPSHQVAFCGNSNRPQALKKRRSENTGWKHMELLMQQKPGNLQYRLRDGEVVESTFNYRCDDKGDLFGFSPMSFSVGGYHARSDITRGQPAVRNLVDANWHKWVPSRVDKKQYYLQLANVPRDIDPDIDRKPEQLWINGLARKQGDGHVAGGLAENHWDYGDFDDLGFNTVYVRLSGNEDPNKYKSEPCFIQIRIYSKSQQRQEPNAWRYFDDLYIDTTLSRVVLANNANYDDATIVEPQIPEAWDQTEITVKVNLGSLLDNGRAFVFVFDSENNHNKDGYCIPVGKGICADSP